MIPYLDQVIPILLESIQDKSFTKKRKNAVKTITVIIQSTGCVIIPYYKYTNLLETMLEIFKQEIIQEIRAEILKLIGCLGAIDFLQFRKNRTKMKDYFIQNNNKNIYKFEELESINSQFREYKFISNYKLKMQDQS